MDDLARFIISRVKCRIHPYIPQGEGWRHYPPHLARILERLEPLHIIAVAQTWVGIDGVYVDDTRGMHDKYSVAMETVEAIFGEAVERAESGNVVLAALATGLWSLSFFQGSIWHLAVCSDLTPYPARFAYIADQLVPCARSKYASRRGGVGCVVATVDGAKVGFLTSENFFREPTVENVRFFGDLLFLAQMRDGWIVDKEVEVSLDHKRDVDPHEYVARVLKDCPGIESFLRYANIEVVLNDSQSHQCRWWRSLVRAVEEAKNNRDA